MRARLRRLTIATTMVLAVVLLAGATYQGVATALERRDFPPSGHRIDIGGHQLHINCTGEGRPVVILEAPATGMSAAWGWVQPEVARHTRVCSYDRAGMGWSEAGDAAYDPRNVPAQLHALLAGARLSAPYIMVGESLGAAFARMYVARYPGDVTAAVLIDDPTPGAGEQQTDSREMRPFVRLVRYSPWLARAGVLRATRLLSSEAEGLPQPAGGAVRAFLNRPDHLTRAGRELARWDETLALAAQAHVSDDLIVQVHTESAEPGTLLTSHAAAAATQAIIQAIQHARAR